MSQSHKHQPTQQPSPGQGTNVVPLAIDPLDPLFFRDGRPFDAGNGRGRSGLPTPRTLSGMIRWQLIERLGVDPTAVKERRHWLSRLTVRGPWLATAGDNGTITDVHLPAPAHLMRAGKGGDAPLLLLSPLARDRALPGWRAPNPYGGQPELAPLWAGWIDDPLQPVAEYLRADGLRAILNGKTPDPKTHLRKASDLFSHQDRTGVGIDAERGTAEDGRLYSVSMISLAPRICFYAELGAEKDNAETLAQLRQALSPGQTFAAPFGGEGRRVAVRALAEAFPWPVCDPAVARAADGFTSLLITPAAFVPREATAASRRQHPPHPLGMLVSAALNRPSRETGWHLEEGRRSSGVPRPMRTLLPAGSIWFWQFGKGALQTIDTLPTTLNLSPSPQHASNGYGVALRGAWKWWGG